MTPIDWFVIAGYLISVLCFGIWMGRKQDTMDDYFLGSRSIPWWAALLSMVATETSAATFLGAPEQGYTRDFTYLQFGIGSIAARFFLAFLFIAMFYKLRVVTVYQFLAMRFGFETKNAAAGTFLLGRIFAGGSRLFIASLAVKVATGMDMVFAVSLLGAIAIFYTWFGGIKAVIWTDVVQAALLMGGALLSLFFLWGDLGLSLTEVKSLLAQEDKLRLFGTGDGRPFAFLTDSYHLLPALVGGFFLTMATHGTDQAMIQRLLTCKDSIKGKLSMVLSGFLGIGVAVIFMIVGMFLYLYVNQLPGDHQLTVIAAELRANGQNGDFFLHYLIHGLPVGLTGLIIAAVIAAAMSSIDSELNAMSATFVNDFYIPYFAKTEDERHFLKVSRVSTVVWGILLILLAVVIADFYESNPETDLLSIALGVMTLFYGGLLGIFLVGLLTQKRGSSKTNITGLSLSVLLIVLLNYKAVLLQALGLANDRHPFWLWLHDARLAWPWFIVLGTAVTVAIAVCGMTSKRVVDAFAITTAKASPQSSQE